MIRILLLAGIVFHSMANAELEGSARGHTRFTNTDKRPSTPISFDVTKYKMNERCTEFIKPDGTLGEWGEALVDAINKVGSDCFYKDADFSYLCPGYKDFPSKEKKNQFLAFLWASIADGEGRMLRTAPPETRCDTQYGAVNSSKNPPIYPVGLMRLEGANELRSRAGRDPIHCGNTTDPKNINFQMNCSAAIFKQIYCKNGSNQIVGKFKHGYWKSLNSDNIAAITAKQFPLCNK